ncbi:hypothetical protein SAMN05421748_110204 [Paractinoplanes atraurantiacus]|uniref:DUF5753 domain-containing protein n=2 Tax=Paractinoplanes atraurantiacus TaxID=1036182 RepID=A0A285IQ30_9ACTN|nr:hypothetical protein SAMN05421748_110204 [Actinoplanes atraurantiacus]
MTRTGDATTSPEARGQAALDELLKREAASVQIHLMQTNYVPGLLQVEGYATEMIGRIRSLDPGDQELADRVRTRMKRAAGLAERLEGEEPPRVSVLIDEGALRRLVGGRETMRKQLAHLSDVAKLPTVELGIVPFGFGAYSGLAGPFEVHRDAQGDDAVYFESTDESKIVLDEAEAERRRRVVDSMMASVVSGDDARALLETISREL